MNDIFLSTLGTLFVYISFFGSLISKKDRYKMIFTGVWVFSFGVFLITTGVVLIHETSRVIDGMLLIMFGSPTLLLGAFNLFLFLPSEDKQK